MAAAEKVADPAKAGVADKVVVGEKAAALVKVVDAVVQEVAVMALLPTPAISSIES